MKRTAHATCPLCDAICGIAVELEGDRVLRIRGDERDPLSRGYVCPKAMALEDVRHDPDRLRRPMKREGDRWFEISWKEAIDEATTKLSELQKAHGKNSVALYVGNPTIHSYSAILPVDVSASIMPGVVSVPHGFGHDKDGAQLGVAGAQPGVSVNDITDEQAIDPVSGCASFSGLPVMVERS